MSREVPSELLASGAIYTFTLRLLNFFGFENTASFAVRVANGALPDVVITAGSEAAALVTHASAALSLFASAAVAVCPGRSASSPSLDYIWSLRSAGSVHQMVFVSQSVDPRVFKLPAFSLNASQSYIVGVTVVDVSSGLNNSALLPVDVGRSPLRAVIDGGDRVVGLESSDGAPPLLSLDASASVDVERGTGQGLVYTWSCNVLDGSKGGTCGGNLTSVNGVVTQNLNDYGVGTFGFTVFVTGKGGGDGRNASASVTIATEIDAVPPVAVRTLDPTLIKVNPSERLILVGTIGPVARAVSTSWSLLTGDLVTTSSADGSLEVRLQHIFIIAERPIVTANRDVVVCRLKANTHMMRSCSPTIAMQEAAATSLTGQADAGETVTTYLVIKAGCLTAGAEYTFKLTGSYLGNNGGTEGSGNVCHIIILPFHRSCRCS